MRQRIRGLHSWQPDNDNFLEGRFLVRVDRAFFRRQVRKPFLELRFVILNVKLSKEGLHWTVVFHGKGVVEIKLVSPCLWLRRRTPQSGSG